MSQYTNTPVDPLSVFGPEGGEPQQKRQSQSDADQKTNVTRVVGDGEFDEDGYRKNDWADVEGPDTPDTFGSQVMTPSSEAEPVFDPAQTYAEYNTMATASIANEFTARKNAIDAKIHALGDVRHRSEDELAQMSETEKADLSRRQALHDLLTNERDVGLRSAMEAKAANRQNAAYRIVEAQKAVMATLGPKMGAKVIDFARKQPLDEAKLMDPRTYDLLHRIIVGDEAVAKQSRISVGSAGSSPGGASGTWSQPSTGSMSSHDNDLIRTIFGDDVANFKG